MLLNSPKFRNGLRNAVMTIIVLLPLVSPSNAMAGQYALMAAITAVALSWVVVGGKLGINGAVALAVLLGALITIAAFQLMPLPASWLAFLRPSLLQGWQLELNSLTVSPWSTIAVLLGCVALLVWVLLLGSDLYVRAQHRQRLLFAVVASATAQAAYGSIALISGADIGAFFELKTAYLDSATGSFVNRSVYALYLNTGLVAAFYLLFFSVKKLDGFVFWATRLSIVILVIGVTLSHSRAAALGLSLLMGLGALLLLLPRNGKRKYNLSVTLLIVASIALVDVLVVSQFFGFDRLVERISETSFEYEQRDDIGEWVLGEAKQGNALGGGVGLGGFESVYASVKPTYFAKRYTRAHNDIAELVLSIGLVLTLITALLFICCLIAQSGDGAKYVWLSIYIPHLLLDFSISNFVVAATACTVLVAMTAQSKRRPRRPDESADQHG